MNILTLYKNASYPKSSGSKNHCNREHSWPKSYDFPDDGADNYPNTDLHHLFASDGSYNSSRSNLPYGECDGSCLERETDASHGKSGTSGIYPDGSNWQKGSGETGNWEVWEERKGDVVRAMFYMAVRYEGGFKGSLAFKNKI